MKASTSPNAQYLEQIVLDEIADNPRVDHFVLVCSAVNFIDTTALDVLQELHQHLTDSNVEFLHGRSQRAGHGSPDACRICKQAGR